MVRRLLICLLTSLAALPAASAAAATPKPFGTLDCAAQEGVRFCQGKVPTFDGVPLDVNVTLPASGEGSFPLIVLSHGWGGQKAPLVATDRQNVSGSSLPWAQRGYAVLSLTARGFNGSCGTPPNRAAAGCERGWIRLDDTRYEIRDAQHMAGRLVDDGLADPERIGAHGGSYGGGVSAAMALLRNRIMQPDGTYAPWRSPARGIAMSLAASAPAIPWSDLVYSLMPNGRTLDYAAPRERDSREPVGVMKQSYVSGLFATGEATGFYSPPGVDPQSDLTSWFARLGAGEPYEGDPVVAQIADEIYTHHSSISIDPSVPPAPIFIASGWTDDLFPVDEAIRLRNLVAERHPAVPFAMMFFDFGHARGTERPADMRRYRSHVVAWMDRYVKGERGATALSGVETLTQVCPESEPSGGPYTAPSWPSMRRGEVRFSTGDALSVSNAGGNPDVARAIDPIAGGGDACAQVSSSDEPGTVNLLLPPATGRGYTLMGAPTVVASSLTTTGQFPQLVARLWDVGTDGRQTLVARAVYRPDASGRQVFQLHANGWRFAPGHRPKLQLLGRDAPYARPSNGPFTVAIRGLELRLPVVDRPGDNPAVHDPRPYVLPPGARPAPGFGAVASADGGGSRQGGSKSRRRRLYLSTGCRTAHLRGPDVQQVKRMTLFRAGMRRRLDRGIPFRISVRGGTGRRVHARVVMRNGRARTVRAALPGRCLR